MRQKQIGNGISIMRAPKNPSLLSEKLYQMRGLLFHQHMLKLMGDDIVTMWNAVNQTRLTTIINNLRTQKRSSKSALRDIPRL